MLQYYKANLCVEARWLVESGVMTETNYNSLAHRQDIRVVRRGCRSTSALVDYESLPVRFKTQIVSLLGNPYDYVKENALLRYLSPSPEAAEFFEAYKVDAVRHLPTETVRRYHADACILDAIARLVAERCGKSAALGHRRAGLWDDIAVLVSLLDTTRWPHSLPRNARSLERKYKAYQAGGYEALVHGQWSNSNAAHQRDNGALLDLVSDPRNLSDTRVAELYNAAHPDLTPVRPNTVSLFRHRHEQDIFARRRGATEFRAKREMTVKRSAPSAPLYLWTLDGWESELMYQAVVESKSGGTKTVYHKRLYVEVVLDACTKYPVGYAIGDSETPDLVRAALRDAVNHTISLFGSRFKPAQLQMDHAGFKTLLPLYEKVAKYVTPAAVRNAKAKVIEPWFRLFNDRYCHLQTNWSGYGATARKESQPNKDYINKFRHDFPDRQGNIDQLTRFLEAERTRLRSEFLEKWEAMPAENRFPMTDEQYLLAFGVRSERTYLLRPTGITLTIGGRKRDYDSFDHEFRRHSSTRWTVVYDPDYSAAALAVSEDGSLRFALEEKYVQPMALIERKEGDAEALHRVWDFNKAEEQRIASLYAGSPDPLRVEGRTEPKTELSRDVDTLRKLLVVDSEGQHKSVLAEARLRAEQETVEDVEDLY